MGESVEKPMLYYQVNLDGTLNLVQEPAPPAADANIFGAARVPSTPLLICLTCAFLWQRFICMWLGDART